MTHRIAVPALIAVALIMGGGGVAYGLANLAVILVALILLAMQVIRPAPAAAPRSNLRIVALLCAATIAIPVLHLVPLPADFWAGLPGRELAVQNRALVGADGWQPLTFDRARTLVALTGLIAPVVMIWAGVRASPSALRKACWLVVAIAIANVCLGAVQVLSQGRTGLLYPEAPMPGVLFGTFANRNSTGLFLACAIVFAGVMPASPRWGRTTVLRLALITVLLVAVVLTRSRSAVVLAAGALAVCAWYWRGAIMALAGRRLLLVAGVVIAVLVTAAGFASATRIGDLGERFGQTGDARAMIWEDAGYAARQYWPAGGGMGTFDEVFQASESLENLTERPAGRAHNDYLEIAIEAGLPGLLVIAAWLAWLAHRAWVLRRELRRSPPTLAAMFSLVAIALQSIVDYPLRNQALLVFVALCIVLILRLPDGEEAQW